MHALHSPIERARGPKYIRDLRLRWRLETSFPLVYTQLVLPGILSLSDAIAKMTCVPAKLLKFPGGAGTLAVGANADIAILDINKKWTVDRDKVQSKSKNTPFHGMQVQGKAVKTLVGGRVIEL